MAALQNTNSWLARCRRFWSTYVGALKRHLDRMEQAADQAEPQKKKTRSTR